MENVPDGESDVSQSYLAMKGTGTGTVPLPGKIYLEYNWIESQKFLGIMMTYGGGILYRYRTV